MMPGSPFIESRAWSTITTPPADGDEIAISSGAAPLRPNVLEKLYGRESYLYHGPFHGFREHIRAQVGEFGATRTWSVTCPRIAIERAGAAGTIDEFEVTGATLAIPALTPATYYYVYAWNNAGAFALEYTNVAPNDLLRTKSGDPTRVYMGCFYTDSTGIAFPQTQSGRRYSLSVDTFNPDSAVAVGYATVSGVEARPSRAPASALTATFMFISHWIGAVTGVQSAGIGTAIRPVIQHSWKSSTAGDLNFQSAHVELPLYAGAIGLFSTDVSQVSAFAVLTGFSE